MRRPSALILFALLFACGSKLDKVVKLQAAGDDAGVVAQVQQWKDKGQLGKEEAELLAAMARSAYNLAKHTEKSADLRAFRAAYPDSPLCAEALVKEYDLAFTEAQTEGTVKAMGDYLAWYPDSPYIGRATVLQQGWAYEDVVAEGTLEALDRFLATAKDSPYRATAWEAVAAKQPGIQVLDDAGRPVALPALPVTDGRITLPATLPQGTARLTFAVNVDGAGRGATSEWFGLRAVDAEGRLSEVTPVEESLSAALRFAFRLPEQRRLETSPGAHTARVAHSVLPLALPGLCRTAPHYAFVLERPGVPAQAWPFSVACPKGALSSWSDTPTAVLAGSLVKFDAADRAGAYADWARLTAMADAAPLLEVLSAATNGEPRAVLDARPSPGDFLVWGTTATGVETAWIHEDGDGRPRMLARRAALVIGNSTQLTALQTTSEPNTTPHCASSTPGAALGPLGGTPTTALFPDAATRIPGMNRIVTPLFSVGPYLLAEERATPCRGTKGGGSTRGTWRVDTGAPTAELDDPSLATQAMDVAKAQLALAGDTVAIDTLSLSTLLPVFNGGDLKWRATFTRTGAPAVTVDVPVPGPLRDWTDTPALVEAWWTEHPSAGGAGWSRVLGDAADAFARFSAP